MNLGAELVSQFPRGLQDYPPAGEQSLASLLSGRVSAEPFNAVATAVFAAAIVHTFVAPRLTTLAHQVQDRFNTSEAALGRRETPSVRAELLHFLGEIEVVFGLWAVVLLFAIAAAKMAVAVALNGSTATRSHRRLTSGCPPVGG